MLSHCGRVRHANQDACAALPEHGVFVVCDGMGGAAGGEVASHLATEVFLDCLAHRVSPPPDPAALDPAVPKSAAPKSVSSRARLAEAIRAANQAVFRHSLLWEEDTQRSKDARVSSTLWLAHVGDSRCYLLRSGALHLLTQDHSLVEEQVCAGLLSRVQATASPMRNIITRAIGSQSTVEPEIASHATQPGDLYLLASDGLSHELEDNAIAQILASAVRPSTLAASRRNSAAPGPAMQSALDTACQELVEAANANGGRDNITVLLVACA